MNLYQEIRPSIRRFYFLLLRAIPQTLATLYSKIFYQLAVDLLPLDKFSSQLSFLFNYEKNVILERFGGSSDGGYFCPPNIANIKYVFSPGHGGIKTFEDHMSLLGKQVYMCDPDFKLVEDLKKHQEFDSIGISSTEIRKDNFMTLENWVNSKVGIDSNNLLLQMGIEGQEWEIFASSDSMFLNRFEVMIVEFHGLDRMLYDSHFASLTKVSLSKLSSSHSNAFCKANNVGGYVYFKGKKFPKVIECTLIRHNSSLLTIDVDTKRRDAKCDYRNNANMPPLAIPRLRLLQ
jgi:hypothetical protein